MLDDVSNPSPASAQRTPESFTETVMLARGTQGPLVGILARPRSTAKVAVMIVAGQPQTRIGAHRMFVSLARELAAAGIASLRFDCGGWGDSPGEPLPFEESAGDITAAAVAFRSELEPDTRLVVFGLCDGASAAVLSLDALREKAIAVDALCLVNPWVRAEAGHAEAMLRTYYLRRLLEPEMWRRLLTGRIGAANLLAPGRYLLKLLRPTANRGELDSGEAAGSHEPTDLPTQLIRALARHPGIPAWTILSGDDLTAGETEALLRAHSNWRERLDGGPNRIYRIEGADHTFTEPSKWRAAIDWFAGRCTRL